MKNAIRLISALVILTVFSSIAIAQEKKTIENETNRIVPLPGWGTKESGNAIWPYYIKLLFEPYEVAPGPLQITILFSPILQCNNATLRITEIERLDFSGETEWTILATTKDTLSFITRLNIPDNDTTGFRLEAEGCGKKQHAYYYFIAKDGKVKVRGMNLSRAAREMEKAARRRPLNETIDLIQGRQ